MDQSSDQQPSPGPEQKPLPAPEGQPEPTKPAYTHRGNGHVARLPNEVRDQIGHMLLDGMPYKKIIESIGEHGKGLVEDHIRKWKDNTFERWRAELPCRYALADTRETAADLLAEKAGVTVQEAGRTIAGAQMYELIKSFEPTAFATALAQKPELYLRLVGALARLSQGEAACSHRRAQEAMITAKLKALVSDDTAASAIKPETLKEIARLIKLL